MNSKFLRAATAFERTEPLTRRPRPDAVRPTHPLPAFPSLPPLADDAVVEDDRLPSRPIAFLWSYVARRPRAFVALLVLVVLAAACSVGVQYGMKLIVDTMAEGDRTTHLIWYCLAMFVTLIAAESTLWRVAGWLTCGTVIATGVDVRLDLFKHLSGHSLAYFSGHLVGSLGNRVTATAGATASILLTGVWKILPPCVDFIGAVIVIATIDHRMALALMVFVAIVGAFMTWFGIRARPLQQRYAEEASKVGGALIDVVSNVWMVQAFSARSREYDRLKAAFGAEADAQRTSWLFLEKARVLHDTMLCLMAGGMLVWAVLAWRAGGSGQGSEAGSVVLISALTFRILHGSRDLALSLVDASQQFGIVEEMLQVVAVPHTVADAPHATTFRPGAGEVRFERVTFAYGAEPPLFVDLDLTIPAGQRVGIVGPSGAGKSTLVKLIQRVADVQSGRVVIDGQPVADVRQQSLRDAIAVVPQEITLLHRTVMENLRYGRPDASDDEVRRAARDARCDDFVRQLPDGYDTMVGERGVRLSGGQRQRIGIARAFLMNAPLLLLDEATSALDSKSEGEIQEALLRLMEGRTVIAVAHRLSTVSSFDRVIVIVDGRVAEDASPQALLDAGGIYAEMWRLQSEGFDTA